MAERRKDGIGHRVEGRMSEDTEEEPAVKNEVQRRKRRRKEPKLPAT